MSLLGRIDALEPQLQAWVYLDREAVLSNARHKEEELNSGRSLGPLHGVPIGLKDIYYTAGIPTAACSKVYADFVPDYDATTVTLLNGAGAIMLGKTVTTEFACMDPSPTVNPWNAAHTPGGSSSGSAVAVAARMCPAALGSQTRRVGAPSRLLQRHSGLQAHLWQGEPPRRDTRKLVPGNYGLDGPQR